MDFTTLRNIIEGAGYEARSYSGRGMYGKECLGFTTDDSFMVTMGNILEELAYVHGHETEEKLTAFAKVLKNAATDSMGLGTIIYFPRIERKEEE